MAFVKIEGTVADHLGSKGFTLKERITTPSGQTFDKIWKVWASQPAIGDFIQVTGTLRADVAKHWETKEILLSKSGQPYVDLTVNDAQVTVLRSEPPAEAAQWAAPATPSNEPAPF